MQSVSPWQAWRARFLPCAESIIGQVPVHRSRSAGLRSSQRPASSARGKSSVASPGVSKTVATAEERVERFFRHGLDDLYPRTQHSPNALKLVEFRSQHSDLKDGETKEVEEPVIVRGRITSTRSSGNKLFFFDIIQDDRNLQAICNFGALGKAIEVETFKSRCGDFARGDVISIKGTPHRSQRGELSIKAIEIPELLSPCLEPFPIAEFDRPEKDKQALVDADRHVQLLTVKNAMDTLRCRSTITKSVREFLHYRSFVEVDTPILGAVASGANARPFETSATEFPDRRLALRVAPELWLKRLILGGLEKVFEIGSSFRNEGLDKTHNPEFTTCEFYQTHTTLDELMTMTEQLLRHVQKRVVHSHASSTIPLLPEDIFEADFPRLDFLPTLENVLGVRLPHLHHSDAASQITRIFKQKSLPLPSSPTLPRLLDKLCSLVIEPRCDRPTFIIHHPQCMSPLSKSFIHRKTGQHVAARAELFINGRELANMYEEENSPFRQGQKFEVQRDFASKARQFAKNADGESAMTEDESLEPDVSYLDALAWGLPPTGGFGCGIDRLVMLFTGKERISDVLTFGNLRRVTRGAEDWS